MKQIIALFLLLAAVIILVGWMQKPGNTEKLFSVANQQTQTPAPVNKTVKIANNEFKIEIAKTQEERKIGLSKHSSLNKNEGLLFVFDKQNVQPPFWMKDMSFPIDIIWINDGKVTQITTNVPTIPEGFPDERIPQYKPARPVDYVLEIGAGETDRLKIKTGDTVELPKLD